MPSPKRRCEPPGQVDRRTEARSSDGGRPDELRSRGGRSSAPTEASPPRSHRVRSGERTATETTATVVGAGEKGFSDGTLEFVVRVQLTDEFLDELALRSASLRDGSQMPQPYMTAAQAAEYLACPLCRVRALTSARRIPFHRDGRRVLFRREELDAWIHQGGANRP
jgi:excisionase family DNA binding protein